MTTTKQKAPEDKVLGKFGLGCFGIIVAFPITMLGIGLLSSVINTLESTSPNTQRTPAATRSTPNPTPTKAKPAKPIPQAAPVKAAERVQKIPDAKYDRLHNKYKAYLGIVNRDTGQLLFTGALMDGTKTIDVTVSSHWHSLTYEERLHMTREIGDTWAGMRQQMNIPGEPGLSIRDENGTQIGGYTKIEGFWVR